MTMTGFKRVLTLAFFSIFFFASCSNDDDAPINPQDPEALYENGFFVVNEGKFPEAGTISFISQDLDSVQQNIFRKVNNEEVGNTPQSLFFDDQGRAYIIANGSNFITVVDRYTFKKLDRISADGKFDVPRYGVAFDGKAYVTNSPFEGDAFLTIIDLADFTVKKTLALNSAAEFICAADNGLIYIQEAAFNEGRQIAVLDPDTDEIVNTIETGQGLNSMAIEDNILYALSAHKLQKFDLMDQSLSSSVDLNTMTDPSYLTIDHGRLYYTSQNQVYEMEPAANSAPDSPLFKFDSGVIYGFAVHNSKIYIADGGDFASDSFVYVYDLQGRLLKRLKVGIGPNGFYFNPTK